MSLNSTLTYAINDVIQKFILDISEKYNLDENEIKLLWNAENKTIPSTSKKVVEKKVVEKKESSSSIDKKNDMSELEKCNKASLIAMCKTYGHKCSGTKDILISRLMGKDATEPVKKIETKSTSVKEATKLESIPIVKKLTANIPNILIRRNRFNNYEHPETGLIFDNATKIIIGTQKKDGSIEDLTEDDIDKCHAFKFQYKLPKNLDHKSTLADVKVVELAEEDDEDELEVDEDELEVVDEEEVVEEELLEEELLDEEDIDQDDEDEDDDEDE
jgi:hypothetical protein